MTSFIVRDAPMTYTHPGVIMYMNDPKPKPPTKRLDESSEDEDDDSQRRDENMKRRDNQLNVNFASMDTEGSSMTASSSSSSIPVDPSTQVPVFVNPEELEFVVAGDHPDTRKVLTLYNPYDYGIVYKILCTEPDYYVITHPTGKIGSKSVIELLIRGKPTLLPTMIHRLKVEIRRFNQTELLGSRILNMRAVVVSTLEMQQPGSFQRMDQRSARGSSRDPQAEGRVQVVQEGAPAVNSSILACVCLLCALALCLPVVREQTSDDTIIPRYFHLTETQRIVAAYILGVCSVLLLQPRRNEM